MDLKTLRTSAAKVKDWLEEKWDEHAPFAYVRDELVHPDGDDVVTLDVPGYRQAQSYTCGYVAGMMVLHYFKPRASAERFWSRCDPETHGLVSESRLVTALRASGVRVGLRSRFTFDDITAAIDGGKPIITTVDDGGHWFVIYGYRKRPERVFVANGSPNRLAPSRERSWADLVRGQGDVRGGLVCSAAAAR